MYINLNMRVKITSEIAVIQIAAIPNRQSLVTTVHCSPFTRFLGIHSRAFSAMRTPNSRNHFFPALGATLASAALGGRDEEDAKNEADRNLPSRCCLKGGLRPCSTHSKVHE